MAIATGRLSLFYEGRDWLLAISSRPQFRSASCGYALVREVESRITGACEQFASIRPAEATSGSSAGAARAGSYNFLAGAMSAYGEGPWAKQLASRPATSIRRSVLRQGRHGEARFRAVVIAASPVERRREWQGQAWLVGCKQICAILFYLSPSMAPAWRKHRLPRVSGAAVMLSPRCGTTVHRSIACVAASVLGWLAATAFRRWPRP